MLVCVCPVGTTPDNPYAINKQHTSAAAAGGEGPAAASTRNIKQTEVRGGAWWCTVVRGRVQLWLCGAAISSQVTHTARQTVQYQQCNLFLSAAAPQVELLEHFYDALCGLVERQRLCDPLSLYVVHQVRLACQVVPLSLYTSAKY
jgi:hypothetical protein